MWGRIELEIGAHNLLFMWGRADLGVDAHNNFGVVGYAKAYLMRS